MCVMCTFDNCLLTLLAERTKSVFPAAICHGVNNQCGMGVMASVLFSEAALMSLEMPEHALVVMSLIMLIPIFITGTVSAILLCRRKSSNDTGSDT